MRILTPEGDALVAEIAQRHGLSVDAVTSMLNAVANGGGTMAQFSIQELGGSGQWMMGGMTMVGDMFNHGLKARVDNLCLELSNLLQNNQLFTPPPKAQGAASSNSQSQYQGSGEASVAMMGQGNGFSNWWPDDLGQPAATGAQNSMRYAYFPQARRLALDLDGHISVYDTLDHAIGGFGQQQSGDASITFTSQYGTVRLDSLPRVEDGVSRADMNQPETAAQSTPDPAITPEQVRLESAAEPPAAQASPGAETDVFATLERLAGLRDKGIITAEDFDAKKAELLSRI